MHRKHYLSSHLPLDSRGTSSASNQESLETLLGTAGAWLSVFCCGPGSSETWPLPPAHLVRKCTASFKNPFFFLVCLFVFCSGYLTAVKSLCVVYKRYLQILFPQRTHGCLFQREDRCAFRSPETQGEEAEDRGEMENRREILPLAHSTRGHVANSWKAPSKAPDIIKWPPICLVPKAARKK